MLDSCLLKSTDFAKHLSFFGYFVVCPIGVWRRYFQHWFTSSMLLYFVGSDRFKVGVHDINGGLDFYSGECCIHLSWPSRVSKWVFLSLFRFGHMKFPPFCSSKRNFNTIFLILLLSITSQLIARVYYTITWWMRVFTINKLFLWINKLYRSNLAQETTNLRLLLLGISIEWTVPMAWFFQGIVPLQ